MTPLQPTLAITLVSKAATALLTLLFIPSSIMAVVCLMIWVSQPQVRKQPSTGLHDKSRTKSLWSLFWYLKIVQNTVTVPYIFR